MTTERIILFDSYETLDDLLLEFHDGRFDLDEMVYTPEARQWSGRFLRRVYDPDHTTRGWHPLRFYFPVIEADVTLNNITGCEVLDEARIGVYSFNKIESMNSGCKLFFNELLEISFEVDGRLTGEWRESETQGYIDTAFGWERGIRLKGE